MFICESCGETFDVPDFEKDYHPYGMGTAAEEFPVCPYCRATDFTRAQQCSRCSELTAELNEGLCEECYGELYDQFFYKEYANV